MLGIKGVSKRIDGCAGMIANAANRAYFSLPQNHKRWIDQEDMIQEGLREAVQAERRYRKSGENRAKYSSYLFEGLQFRFAHIWSAIQAEKRSTAGLVELDAPVAEGSTAVVEVPATATQGNSMNAVQSFVELCRAVSGPSQVALIRGFVFGSGDSRYFTEDVFTEVREAARRLKISIGDLRPIVTDEKIREKLLTELAKGVMLEMGTEAKLRCLECVECTGQHDLESVREGRFFVSVMTCRSCLDKARAKPETCFGKPDQPGRVGYSSEATECRLHCQDRQVCQKYVKGEIVGKAKAAEVELDDLDDLGELDEEEAGGEEGPDDTDAGATEAEGDEEEVDVSDIKATAKATKAKAKPKSAKTGKKAAAKAPAEKPKAKGKKTSEAPAKTGKAAKPAKPAKEPKKPKAEEPDPDPCPPEVGPRWPFKAGSMMREVFKRMYKGANKKELEDMVKKAKFNWPFMLSCMRSLQSGKTTKTHSWKMNEDGRFKIYDVKYLLKDTKKGGK